MTQLIILLSIAFTVSVNVLTGTAVDKSSVSFSKSTVAECKIQLYSGVLEESDADFDDFIERSKIPTFAFSGKATSALKDQSDQSASDFYLKPIRAPPTV